MTDASDTKPRLVVVRLCVLSCFLQPSCPCLLPAACDELTLPPSFPFPPFLYSTTRNATH